MAYFLRASREKMQIDSQSQSATFHVCFSAFRKAQKPRPRKSYVGIFMCNGLSATLKGYPLTIFRVVMVLSAVLGAIAMVVLSLLNGHGPDSTWLTLRYCTMIVAGVALAGLLVKLIGRVKIPLDLVKARIDVGDEIDELYVHIFLPGGKQYLRLLPDPDRPADFRRLRIGLIEILSSQPLQSSDAPAGSQNAEASAGSEKADTSAGSGSADTPAGG